MDVLLIHSPYGPASTWIGVADSLRRDGHAVCTPSFSELTEGPGAYWPRHLDAVAKTMAGREVVLVGHSGAGPLLPAMGTAHGRVRGYVFVDATLPVDGYRRADSVTAEERQSRRWREAAARGEAPNPWRDVRMWRRVGVTDRALVERLAAETPRIPLTMHEEPISVPDAWPDAPVSYLAFRPNPFYAATLKEARARGWTVEEMAGGHFHMLVDPAAVAREVAGFVARMSPMEAAR